MNTEHELTGYGLAGGVNIDINHLIISFFSFSEGVDEFVEFEFSDLDSD